MDQKTYFIIDFDSTFVRIEALDTLAEIALRTHPQKVKRLNAIEAITARGMRGAIPFDQSLASRLKLFSATKEDIRTLVRVLKENITPSILRNKEFFRTYKDDIYIISGGFKEFIAPVIEPFGIDPSHILANEFLFDEKGKITGFNRTNVLSKERGKVKQVSMLKLNGTIYVIGDGYTDFQIKNEGSAHAFFAFCENVQRESVSKQADYVLPNLDEFLYLLHLPRSYSYPKNRIKVLLLERIPQRDIERFKKEGYTVESVPGTIGEAELAEKIRDVSILGIRSKTHVTQNIIDNARRLIGIGAFCMGTSHIDLAGCTKKGIVVFSAASVAEKIIRFINTGSTARAINFPRADLPVHDHAHRILHIHNNVPGALAKINNVFAVHSVNILGQYLATNSIAGFVITDVEKSHTPQVIEQLRRIPETIRLRLLY